LSKVRKLPFVANNNYSDSSFDLIHYDTWGPIGQPTYNGKHYFLAIVDDHTRYTWVHVMARKDEATHLIQSPFQDVGATHQQVWNA